MPEVPSFPTTQWSLIDRAGSGGLAMGVLLHRYLPALRAFLLLERRVTGDHCDDLLQGFVAQILERGLLAKADPRRGRFRTFLLGALKHYVIDESRSAAAQKRRPADGDVLGIDEATSTAATIADSCPAAAFEAAWARQTLAEAVRRMRAECEISGRHDLWGVFQCRILDPSMVGGEPLPYDQVVRQFGFQTPAHASNALTTTKRMFARALKAVVAEYAQDETDIEREIGELRSILAGTRR